MRRKNYNGIRAIFLLMSILFSGLLQAQSITVSGKVTDSGTGEGIPGVNIQISGTTTGTISDTDGNYTITIPNPNSALSFSFVGYLKEEVQINGQTEININLTEDIVSLDELVVVGYGSQKKSDLTGAVANVSSEELKKYSTNDVSQMLQGRAAGVAVTSDGEAGASPSVIIRGVGSFGDSQPLYVIDGVPVTGQRDFSTNDIESVSILKDASACAIYGTRAANGVVLITTKKGKKETPLKISYSGYFGVDDVYERIDVTGREDYQMLQNEMFVNGGYTILDVNNPESDEYIDDIDTDWQEEAYKTGTRQNHSLNFSGGSSNTIYNMSLDYFQNKGTFTGSGPNYDRYSGRINTESERGIFKVGGSLFLTHSFQDGLTATSDWLSGGRPPMVVDLVTAQPIVPVYDDSRVGGFGGAPNDGSQGVSTNVIGLNTLITNTTEVDRYLGSFFAEAEILPGLKIKTNFSYDRTFARDIKFSPLYDMGYFINNTESSKLYDDERIYSTSNIENTINYDKQIGKHKLSVLVGQMFWKYRYDYKGCYTEDIPEPYYVVLDNGTNQSCSGNYTESTLLSYLGRINYSYDNRYLLTLTTRLDASSRFAADNRWGTFPSAAAAWKIHNETFLQLPDVISQLKLRASYGTLGNQNIGDYLYSATVNQNIPYNWNGTAVVGGAQTQLVDEDIKWEEKAITNIGLDASFFNNALEWSFEYYNSKTSDLLVEITPPATTGANNDITTNAASMRNYGVETQITYHKIKGDFTFDISVNASTLENEILSLGGKEYIDEDASRTVVGGRLGDFFGYVYDGIFQSDENIDDYAYQTASTSAGDIRFKDVVEDGTIDESDRTYLGRALPKYYYGFNFSAAYKGFDFTMNASGSGGNKIHGNMYASLMHTTNYTNFSTEMLGRWTEDNPSTTLPRLCQDDPNSNGRMSDRPGWLQSGTYLRLNTISLGYTVPLDEIEYVSSVRFYATCQNVYTFKKYKGFNPDFVADDVFSPGYDIGSYPKPRIIMLGVQASF